MRQDRSTIVETSTGLLLLFVDFQSPGCAQSVIEKLTVFKLARFQRLGSRLYLFSIRFL